ncbi:MAG: peptidase C11 [Lachnospiraceae bacterium]|nr:peptidase C11 [Lachnospiraceae bacterium]
MEKTSGRKTNVTGEGKSVYKRGEGQGTGPVGTGSGHVPGSGGSSSGGSGSSGSSGGRATRGGGSKLLILAVIAFLVFGGGGGILSGLFGGGGNNNVTPVTQAPQTKPAYTVPVQTQAPQTQPSQQSSGMSLMEMLLGGNASGSGVTTSGNGWTYGSNVGRLNTNVSSQARKKFTTIKGNGQDTVTILVYMCGTDLESRSAMSTKDLNEMLSATYGPNVNVILYTGGCKKWQNNTISSSVNQIYRISSRGFERLVDNAGQKSMVSADTLLEFLNYGKANYPANRMMLVFWDHGGGSISGYGYDEKCARSGSMPLDQINVALQKSGMTFDMIGFDCCLMATAENALMLSKYADYMVASEETEPGVGWYYTTWLTNLNKNPSMPTLELGKQIVDSFVEECNKSCRGQQTTLSVVDLSELSQTLSTDLAAFARGTKAMITGSQYKTVSNARSNTREFAQSTRIDQIDLVHFANNVGSAEGKALANTLLSAIKYNRTGNMTNAYGLSIFFPYRKASSVRTAVSINDKIGVDDEYSECIREFASVGTSGQLAAGGSQTSSPLSSLFGTMAETSSSQSADQIGQLINMFLGGGGSSSSSSILPGFSGSDLASLFSGRSLSLEQTAQYIAENQFDTENLFWETKNGTPVLSMSDDQWDMIQTVDLNVYVDDGEGYIDLGLDNVYEFNDDGDLVGTWDGSWVALNSQPVAFYHTDTTFDFDAKTATISGYVPAYLTHKDEDGNEVKDQVRIILIWDQDHEDGYVAGAEKVYAEGETETMARGLIEIEKGDKIDFLCDYYKYDGTYQDSYMMGDPMVVGDALTISNVRLQEKAVAMYKLTDIYGQGYFTETIPR